MIIVIIHLGICLIPKDGVMKNNSKSEKKTERKKLESSRQEVQEKVPVYDCISVCIAHLGPSLYTHLRGKRRKVCKIRNIF